MLDPNITVSYYGYMGVKQKSKIADELREVIRIMMRDEYLVESEARQCVAQKIGRTKRSIDRYLSGERLIPLSVADKISSIL